MSLACYKQMHGCRDTQSGLSIADQLGRCMSPKATLLQRTRLFATMKLLSYRAPEFDLVEFRDGAVAAFGVVERELREESVPRRRLMQMVETDSTVLDLQKVLSPQSNAKGLQVEEAWVTRRPT